MQNESSPLSCSSARSADTSTASLTWKQYSESDVLMSIGFLSAEITELHGVEVPRLKDAWDTFKVRTRRFAGRLGPDLVPPVIGEEYPRVSCECPARKGEPCSLTPNECDARAEANRARR